MTERLQHLHHDLAAPEYLDATERLGVAGAEIPQLQDIAERLDELTAFRVQPAAGVVPFAEFGGSLADVYFHSTQYLRDASEPFHSAEPDVLHEVVGHCNALAHDRFAALYRVAGGDGRRGPTRRPGTARVTRHRRHSAPRPAAAVPSTCPPAACRQAPITP